MSLLAVLPLTVKQICKHSFKAFTKQQPVEETMSLGKSYSIVPSFFEVRMMRTRRREARRESAKENKARTNKYASTAYMREGGSNEQERASYVLIK